MKKEYVNPRTNIYKMWSEPLMAGWSVPKKDEETDQWGKEFQFEEEEEEN